MTTTVAMLLNPVDKDNQPSYYERNRDQVREHQRVYRETNRERIRAIHKAYYRKNRAKITAYKRERWHRTKSSATTQDGTCPPLVFTTSTDSTSQSSLGSCDSTRPSTMRVEDLLNPL
ncbi:hypothetical protein AaE_011565 [Aphanomyces astaci]|uniref:Uncharacterized protein n=2 Tax=Aphanomyces astaci TaxID=112090 RepID=A0A6A4ZQK4_APHAT|nr:hypothetical protein AaE_011565 [Aphanomyces astaci]